MENQKSPDIQLAAILEAPGTTRSENFSFACLLRVKSFRRAWTNHCVKLELGRRLTALSPGKGAQLYRPLLSGVETEIKEDLGRRIVRRASQNF